MELQLALTPVVREGEKGSSLLSVSSFCGAACLAKTVTELGRRDAMRCAASSKRLLEAARTFSADLLLAARGHMDRSSDAHAPFRLVYEL